MRQELFILGGKNPEGGFYSRDPAPVLEAFKRGGRLIGSPRSIGEQESHWIVLEFDEEGDNIIHGPAKSNQLEDKIETLMQWAEGFTGHRPGVVQSNR